MEKTAFQKFVDSAEIHYNDKSNPHEVTSKQIWGLDKVENTSDSQKPISVAMQEVLDTKLDKVQIRNLTTSDNTKDLTKMAWSAAQAYSMNNTIDTYKAQDTTAIESRIAALEKILKTA